MLMRRSLQPAPYSTLGVRSIDYSFPCVLRKIARIVGVDLHDKTDDFSRADSGLGPDDFLELGEERPFARAGQAPIHRNALIAVREAFAVHPIIEVTP